MKNKNLYCFKNIVEDMVLNEFCSLINNERRLYHWMHNWEPAYGVSIFKFSLREEGVERHWASALRMLVCMWRGGRGNPVT